MNSAMDLFTIYEKGLETSSTFPLNKGFSESKHDPIRDCQNIKGSTAVIP